MNITSVTSSQIIQSQLGTPLPADQDAPGPSATSAGQATVTNISGPGRLMQQLQALHDSDPDKFKQVVGAMANSLRADAQSETGQSADHLNSLASKLDQVAKSGDLSQLAPQHAAGAGPGAAGGHHGHHGHHGHGGGGSGIGADVQKALTDALASLDQAG